MPSAPPNTDRYLFAIPRVQFIEEFFIPNKAWTFANYFERALTEGYYTNMHVSQLPGGARAYPGLRNLPVVQWFQGMYIPPSQQQLYNETLEEYNLTTGEERRNFPFFNIKAYPGTCCDGRVVFPYIGIFVTGDEVNKNPIIPAHQDWILLNNYLKPKLSKVNKPPRFDRGAGASRNSFYFGPIIVSAPYGRRTYYYTSNLNRRTFFHSRRLRRLRWFGTFATTFYTSAIGGIIKTTNTFKGGKATPNFTFIPNALRKKPIEVKNTENDTRVLSLQPRIIVNSNTNLLTWSVPAYNNLPQAK
jgi:hypothetical protein